MSSPKLRSRNRQRLRAGVYATVLELPLPYVLEAVAKELDVRSGRFEVSVSDGFLREVIRRDRFFDVRWYDGTMVRQFGDEKFIPAGLWERPPRVTRRIVHPWHRNVAWRSKLDPGPA
jgi:hypothetical protein